MVWSQGQDINEVLVHSVIRSEPVYKNLVMPFLKFQKNKWEMAGKV